MADKVIKVRAKDLGRPYTGYYGNPPRRIRAGEIFYLKPQLAVRDGKKVFIPAEKAFSEKWMERVPPEYEAPKQKPKFNEPKEEAPPEEAGGDETPTGDQRLV